MTGCRRPILSACHQVFSRSRSPMPTGHSLASAQSTAGCFFVWTMLFRVDPWRNQLTYSASKHATLVSHLHADSESAPEFLEKLSRRSTGPALGSDQRRWRQSDKFQVLSWNAGPAHGKFASTDHGTQFVFKKVQVSSPAVQFPCGERPRRHQAQLRRSPQQGYFCARLNAHRAPDPSCSYFTVTNIHINNECARRRSICIALLLLIDDLCLELGAVKLTVFLQRRRARSCAKRTI